MRKVTVLILISFLILTSFKYPKNVIGNWSIVKVEKNGKVMSEIPFNQLTLEMDGVVKIGKDNMSKSGTWVYDKNNKLIKIVFEGKSISDGNKEFKILNHSKTKLTLENSSFTMFLEKKK